MKQSGEYLIPAPAEAVWAALNDETVLQACLPGCQSMTRTDEHHFEAAVKAKVGPVSATFKAEIELQDVVPPSSYVLVGNAKGGAAGFGKGTARVALEPEADATRLRYEVDANVGGKLAQVGSRLIDGAARKMADDFFAGFSSHFGGSQVQPEQALEQAPVAAAAAAAGGERFEASGQWTIWAIAVAVFVFAMLVAL